MAHGLVLRAWSDTANGGQYSVLHRGGCVSLIPIPETNSMKRTPCFLRPQCLLSCCSLRPLSFYMARYSPVLHNDPRLDKGFYTGYWAPRGRLPKSLKRSDVLLFVAGLVWEDYAGLATRPRRLVEKGLAGIYFVGGIVIEEMLDTRSMGWKRLIHRWPQLVYSPHYWRKRDNPVAVVGQGFMLKPPLPASQPGTLRAPSEAAIELLGAEAARGLARNRFRRSRLVELSLGLVKVVAERHGSRIARARHYVCSPNCLRRKPI